MASSSKYTRGRLSRILPKTSLSSPPQRTRSPRATLSHATQAPCSCKMGVLSLRIRLRKLSVLARAATRHSLDANMPISVTQRSHKSSCREVLETIQFQRYVELYVVRTQDSNSFISVTFQTDLCNESYSSPPREGAARPFAPQGNFEGIDWPLKRNVHRSHICERLSLLEVSLMKVWHDRVAHRKTS
jgi:hypothetical protein